ncbi:MAG: hypothetical protein K2M22_04330 [Lachnospiraceae bacterium]|nr:hypothetical protein [Lachnospiraceae bacterium]
MKLKKTKRILSTSVLISICILTGCAGKAAASVHNGTLLSATPASDIGIVQDSSAVENPGYVDYSVYEPYGLSFDEKTGCYTYNGDIVRFFNDPAAGASFTNYFTGTVDIEAKRDADNNLIGIEECSQEVYDRHTQKHERFQSMDIGAEPDTAIETGTGQGNRELLKDYEGYGVSYNSQDSRWYYGADEIKILVDSEKDLVYYTDEKGVCLAVSRDGNHNITEIKTISESDAELVPQANKPSATGDYATEEKQH